MRTSLVPCPSCHRHVRSSESACPFCQGALPSDLGARAVPGTTQRLSRAAAFTFAATLAATGCSSDTSPADASTVTDTGATTDTGGATDTGSPTDRGTATDTGTAADTGTDAGMLAMYGGPPADSGVDAGTPDDHGGIAPLYGLPADAGPSDSGAPTDNGGIAPLYGAVPADAGDASIGVRYGAPPPPVDAG